MFTIFNGGIKNTQFSRIITFDDLCQIIKFNKDRDKIIQIRKERIARLLDKNGYPLFKTTKKSMPYITPNGVITTRNLSNFQNFLQSSGYIYLDIDVCDISNVESYKKWFIDKFNHLVALVCISISGGGLSVLIRVDKDFKNPQEFDDAREFIINKHFPEINFDADADGIGRAMFLSYDADLFINKESCISLNDSKIFKNSRSNSKREKPEKQYIHSGGGEFNSLFVHFLDIGEVFEKTKWKKEIIVNNSLFDFREEDYAAIFFPKIINDGSKRKVFKNIFRVYLYLNPNLPFEYVVSFIWYLNSNYTDESRMSRKDFKDFMIKLITSYKTGKLNPYIPRVKKFHANQNSNLSKEEKRSLASKINGIFRRKCTIDAIKNAKLEILKNGKKLNYTNVAKLIGKSPKTVKRHWESESIDFEAVLKYYNSIDNLL